MRQNNELMGHQYLCVNLMKILMSTNVHFQEGEMCDDMYDIAYFPLFKFTYTLDRVFYDLGFGLQ